MYDKHSINASASLHKYWNISQISVLYINRKSTREISDKNNDVKLSESFFFAFNINVLSEKVSTSHM